MQRCLHCNKLTLNRIRHSALLGSVLQKLIAADCLCSKALITTYNCYVCGAISDKNRRLLEAEMCINLNDKSRSNSDYVTTTTFVCSDRCASTVSQEVITNTIDSDTTLLTPIQSHNPDRPGKDVLMEATRCCHCGKQVDLLGNMTFCVGEPNMSDYNINSIAFQTAYRICKQCPEYLANKLLKCVHCGKVVAKNDYHLLDNTKIHIRSYSCDNAICTRTGLRLVMQIGKKFCDNISITSLCNTCHNQLDKPLWCSRCKAATYCSDVCQKKDWNEHKSFCIPTTTVDAIVNMIHSIPNTNKNTNINTNTNVSIKHIKKKSSKPTVLAAHVVQAAQPEEVYTRIDALD